MKKLRQKNTRWILLLGCSSLFLSGTFVSIFCSLFLIKNFSFYFINFFVFSQYLLLVVRWKKKTRREEKWKEKHFFLNEFMEKARTKWRRKFEWNECLIKGDLPSFLHNKWSLVKFVWSKLRWEKRFSFCLRFTFKKYARAFCVVFFSTFSKKKSRVKN